MTAAALTPSKEYIENGVTLAYAVPFRFRAATHIKAQRISTDGVVTELVYGTDYSVTGGETDAGGTLTVSVAGAAGTRLRIRRETPRSQDMDYTTGDTFPAESHEAALDKAILIDQEQDQKINDTASRSHLVPDGETAGLLPALAQRIGKFFGWDPTGNPIALSGTGNDTALRTDLANSAIGAMLIAWKAAGVGAAVRTLWARMNDLPLSVFDYVQAGEDISIDAGPAIRRAFATGKPVRFYKANYVVDYDPASAFDDGGTTRYSWCISIPTGATLIFEDGATIQAKAGQKNWNRTVVAVNVSNFRIFGELKVDANVLNIGTPNNEHMHGVFLFNATNFYIEAINSQNARGDNVYLGGTDNSRGTSDGYIGRIAAKVAGRKNLVWQAIDNIDIGSAYLDNSSGGAAIYSGVADTTDGNCFDVEPDSFTGATRNSGTIGYLYTKGAGNDFTAGTTATQADNFVVNIGQWDCVIVPRSTVPWHTHYGMTLNIGAWTVTGITATAATAEFYYACRLNADTVKITGVRTDVNTPFFIAAWNATTPEIVIKHLDISGTGIGFENRDGFIKIGYYRARTTGIAFWNRGTSGTAGIIADLVIDTLDMSDVGQPSGAGYGFLASMTTNQQSCRIGHIRFRDTRTPKLNYVGYSGSGASAGVFLGTIDNNTTVPLIGYGGTDTFYRRSGGVGTPGDFVVTGTPEAKITAPVGSFARRTDGGAGTSIYVKESGTGNTGWVGK